MADSRGILKKLAEVLDAAEEKEIKTDPVDIAESNPPSDFYIKKNEIKTGVIPTELGRGGTSIVYKGKLRGKTTVAIKEMRSDVSFYDVDDFKNEAAIMKKLRMHCVPHTVFFYGVIEGSCSLVTQYMPYQLVENTFPEIHSLPVVFDPSNHSRTFPLTPGKEGIAYQVMMDVFTNAAALHQLHILNRDYKTLNVLLDENKRAYVCDFGFAKEVPDISCYETEKSLGSRGYKAPEIYLQDDGKKPRYSDKSDIYALGTAAWEILTGVEPFEHDDLAVTKRKVKQGIRENIPIYCPKTIKALIENSWLADPKLRPTAEEWVVSMQKDAEIMKLVESAYPKKPKGM